MVEKRKSGKDADLKAKDVSSSSNEKTDDVGGLAESLEALMVIAEKGEERDRSKVEAEDVIHLSSRKDRAKDKTAGSAKQLVDELDEKYSVDKEGWRTKARKGGKSNKGQKEKADKDQNGSDNDALAVVDLLGALKSDIECLRKENEEFKVQVMKNSGDYGNGAGEPASESNDVRSLLAALKADIGSLRDESNHLRAQTFATQQDEIVKEVEEQNENEESDELYSMLADLKQDIIDLRSENEALSQGKAVPPVTKKAKKNDEVALMLRALKSDINDLKHENDSLRLEQLTARDGAHFENLGGQQGDYRNPDNNVLSSLLKGFGVLALVMGAAGGGYYLATKQLGAGTPTGLSPDLAALDISRPADQPAPTRPQPASATPPAAPAQTATKPSPIKPQTARKKQKSASLGVSVEVESAMMNRAQGLMQARDLGAARMVFVYLARHGSASAMNKLAQTYDPDFLRTNQFDERVNGDPARALRLYKAASSMGDTNALVRLRDMQ